MSEADWAPLLQLAEDSDAALIDRWGRSSVSITNSFDFRRLDELGVLPSYRTTAYFGETYKPLTLGESPPRVDEVGDLAGSNPALAAEIMGAPSSLAVAEILANSCVDVTVEFARNGWARTAEAFARAVAENWVAVATDLPQGQVVIGPTIVRLATVVRGQAGEQATDLTAKALPAAQLPVQPRPEAPPADLVWDTLVELADAVAWAQIAVRVRRVGVECRAALHSDQDATVRLTLKATAGGAELLRWWGGGVDGDREEALRHVLRFVTAVTPIALPAANVVRSLAERQRIALASDRAAEVVRAMAEGRRDTADLLETTADALSGLVEDSTKLANATLVAVLGVVALAAREAQTLPEWLLILATIGAVIGVSLVVASRWSRVEDYKKAITRLETRLAQDPLLPQEDHIATQQIISDFRIDQRARQARIRIVVLGVVATTVAVAAGAWLVARPTPSALTPATASTSTVPVTKTSSSLVTTPVQPVGPTRP